MSDHSIIGNLLLWRKIIESEIWTKPPLYLKVWVWLLCEARYHPDNVLKRGQCFVSIDEIREKNSHMVGYRKETPTRKQIWEILEWMRKTSNKEYSDNSRARNPHEADAKGYNEGNMIETTKVTHGLIVTICNYDKYQDKTRREGNNEKPHEGNNEAEAKRTEGEQYNKKEGCKKDKTHMVKSGDLPVSEDDVVQPKYSESFLLFWEEYPRKVHQPTAYKAWLKIATEKRATVKQIIEGLKAQKAANMFDLSEKKKHCPYPASWLNADGWRDEIITKTSHSDKQKKSTDDLQVLR